MNKKLFNKNKKSIFEITNLRRWGHGNENEDENEEKPSRNMFKDDDDETLNYIIKYYDLINPNLVVFLIKEEKKQSFIYA